MHRRLARAQVMGMAWPRGQAHLARRQGTQGDAQSDLARLPRRGRDADITLRTRRSIPIHDPRGATMPTMSTLKPWLRWLADVGPTRAGWRIGHEFITRSGVVERLAPVGELPELSSSDLTLRQWLHGLPSDHWFRITRDRITSDEARAARKLLSECMSQSCTV